MCLILGKPDRCVCLSQPALPGEHSMKTLAFKENQVAS
jgi:hypothetical protein